jgi:FkbM family methyltransferase
MQRPKHRRVGLRFAQRKRPKRNGRGEPQLDRYLIYDLGLHRGNDTEYYLNKGFKVIALEANPGMVKRARRNPVIVAAEQEGRLGIVTMALWHKSGESISFYVNSKKDDWSSVDKTWAEKGAHETQEIKVPTITLADMFEKLGVPYYVKCDLEGADAIFSEQLARQTSLPAFVSCENSDPNIVEHFREAGYDCFQFVNQARHHEIVSPNPAREGNFFETQFTGHMSGLFGLDLPLDRWISYEEVQRISDLYGQLRRSKFALSNAWYDLHATKKETLAAAGAIASV